jgi:hypothetical protein
MRKKPGFPVHSRVSWEGWLNAGLRGWGRPFDPTPVGRLGAPRGGHKCVRRILKEGRNNGHGAAGRTSEDFRYLKTGCFAAKPLDGSSVVEMP